MAILVAKPSEFGGTDIARFLALLAEREGIRRDNLERRVMRCYLLALYSEGEALIGIAAIKKASRQYMASVSKLSGLPRPLASRREVGWAFVRSEFRGRGIATALLQVLLQRNHGRSLFAVVAETDNVSRHILGSNDFRGAGIAFNCNDRRSLLYVRPMQ